MPTVPSYGGAQAAPGGAAGQRFDAPQITDPSGQQLQQLGDGMQRAGGAAANIVNDMQQQVNQVRIDDALNKARARVLDLTFNQQTGYANLKGDAALTRPDGKSLAEEYGTQLHSTISDLTASLGNDHQRLEFTRQAGNLAQQFDSSIVQHTNNEYRSHSLSVQEGTQKIGMDEAFANWQDPDKVQHALDSVKASVIREGSLRGWSGSETTARLKITTSGVHMGVIDAAMQEKNPAYALGYMAAHKDEMTADDILKTTGLVNHAVDGSTVMTAVQGATDELSHAFQPTNIDRLHGVVMGMESGGNPNAVGKNIPGQGTAKGAMQVMDATMQKPGFGLPELPANATPEQRAQQGHRYLDALVKHYGNPAQAMAAYNAGPGRLDDAIADAKKAGTPDAWLTRMPKETQAYVTNGMSKLGAGAGAPPFPTESAFVESVVAKLGPNPRIEQMKMARDQAVSQYSMLDKSRKEQSEQALMSAQQELIQNGGSMAMLSPKAKADVIRMAPDKYDNLNDFAAKVASPVKVDNLAAYNQARSNPAELAAMPDATFQAFVMQNFTPSTAREMVKFRQEEKDGGHEDRSPGALNRSAVDRVLNERLDSLQIPRSPSPKEKDQRERLGGIRAFVDRSILDAQKQSGKKFTAEEINQHVTGLFAKDVSFKKTLWYGSVENSSENLMSMQKKDLPSGAYEGLRKSLITSGNRAPTDTDVLNLYRRLHAGK